MGGQHLDPVPTELEQDFAAVEPQPIWGGFVAVG